VQIIKPTIVLILLFFTVHNSHSNTISYPEYGYTITLPRGWAEIPQAALESYKKILSKQYPNPEYIDFVKGYQLQSKELFEYPYVFVKIDVSGKFSEQSIRQATNETISKKVKEMSKGENYPDISKMTTSYDSISHITWSTSEVYDNDLGFINNLIGTKLTESGFIQFLGYVRKSDIEKYNFIIREMIYSVKLDDNLKYKSLGINDVSASRGINWEKVVANSILGGLIAFIYSFTRKNRNRKPYDPRTGR